MRKHFFNALMWCFSMVMFIIGIGSLFYLKSKGMVMVASAMCAFGLMYVFSMGWSKLEPRNMVLSIFFMVITGILALYANDIIYIATGETLLSLGVDSFGFFTRWSTMVVVLGFPYAIWLYKRG